MITYSGRSVYPDGGAPSLKDIGIGLSAAYRFRRQTEYAYPVLGHVLTVAVLLPEEIALHGLLHDSAEAILGDMPATWKTEADEAREALIMARIYLDNDLSWPLSDETKAAIKVADHRARAGEAHVVKHPKAQEYWPDPDEESMVLTKFHLGLMDDILHSLEIAGAVFEEAFDNYKVKLKEEVSAG